MTIYDENGGSVQFNDSASFINAIRQADVEDSSVSDSILSALEIDGGVIRFLSSLMSVDAVASGSTQAVLDEATVLKNELAELIAIVRNQASEISNDAASLRDSIEGAEASSLTISQSVSTALAERVGNMTEELRASLGNLVSLVTSSYRQWVAIASQVAGEEVQQQALERSIEQYYEQFKFLHDRASAYLTDVKSLRDELQAFTREASRTKMTDVLDPASRILSSMIMAKASAKSIKY